MGNKTKRRAEKYFFECENLEENFHPQSFFESERPLGLELGMGKGRFLRDRAFQKPHVGYLGVELKKDRANKAALKLEDVGLESCRIIRSDVKDFFARIDPEARFDVIHLNFPDPWPKKRHTKNRLLNPQFIELYVKALKKGGALVFVTDDPDYAIYGQENLQAVTELVDVFDGIRMNWPCYPVSIHEEKFREWGRSIHYQKFVKKVK